MPNAFNFNASPFDCLTQAEQRLVRDSVDVAYFPEGAAILEVGIAPTHLFVIIKGYVSQMEGSEVITSYGPDDCFDGRGLVAGKVSSRFVAAEEVVARGIVPKADRETVRVVMSNHALKPWREKNVVRPGDNAGIRGEDGGRP